MKKMDWRMAQLKSKRSLSTVDEKDYRERDAAARWLEKRSQPTKGADQKPKRSRPK